MIKVLKMEVSKVRDEKDGSTNYVLVSLADNKLSRKSSLRPPQQLEFFKRILSAILSSESKSIPVTDAVNLALESDAGERKGKLGVGQAELLVKKWISERLLDDAQDGDLLVLGFVGLAEFGHLIKSHYADAYTQCPSCTMLCLRGVSCLRCSSSTHVHCTGTTVPDHFSSFLCLSCRSQ